MESLSRSNNNRSCYFQYIAYYIYLVNNGTKVKTFNFAR